MKNTIKMSLVAALAVAGLSSTASADFTILEPQDKTIKMSKTLQKDDYCNVAKVDPTQEGPAIAVTKVNVKMSNVDRKYANSISLSDNESSGGDANMLSQTDMPKKWTKMMSLVHADNVAGGVAGTPGVCS